MKILVTYEHGLGDGVFGGGQRILIEALKCIGPSNQITLLVPGPTAAIIKREFEGLENIHIVLTPYTGSAVLNGILLFIYFLVGHRYRTDVVVAFTSELFYIVLFKRIFRSSFKIKSYLAAPDLNGFYGVPLWEKLKAIRYRFDLFLFLVGFRLVDEQYAISRKILNDASRIFSCDRARVVYPGVPRIDDVLIEGNIKKGRSNNISIGYVGRINFGQKPLEPLFEALRLTQDRWTCFHVIGSGPDLNAVEAFAQTLGDGRVVIHGNKPFSFIEKISGQLDLVILPSKEESFMLTAYEMVALGIPVAVCDVADIRETLFGYSTILLIRNHSDWLSKFIREYDNVNIDSNELRRAAMYVRSKFNWSALGRALESR